MKLALAVLVIAVCLHGHVRADAEGNTLWDFFNAMGGPQWAVNTGWVEDGTPCTNSSKSTYFGVECSDHLNNPGTYFVNVIKLTGNKLAGTLPASLGNLTGLQTLMLGNEELNSNTDNVMGPLPSSWYAWTNVLHISCTYCKNLGNLPSAWSALTNLRVLKFPSSGVTGAIPASWGPAIAQITTVDLGNNQLTAVNGFGGSKLTQFDVSNNQIAEAVPDFSTWTAITYLDLHNNFFSGTVGPIPQTATLTLDLSFNQLNGSYSFLGGWVFNTVKLDGNKFSGPLPAMNNENSQLNYLSLNGNSVLAPLPNITLPKLTTLLLANCSLTGALPDLTTVKLLTRVDLSGNKLTGYLPSGFTAAQLAQAFPQLTSVCLADNSFWCGSNNSLPQEYCNGTVPQGQSCVQQLDCSKCVQPNSCCSSSSLALCSNAETQSKVCAEDISCCYDAWTSHCVSLANCPAPSPSGLSGGAIAGIVIGVLAFVFIVLAIAAGLFYWFYWRKRHGEFYEIN